MYGVNEVHCEYIQDLEVLMKNRSRSALEKTWGPRGLLCWSEDWWIEMLQNYYFFPNCN